MALCRPLLGTAGSTTEGTLNFFLTIVNVREARTLAGWQIFIAVIKTVIIRAVLFFLLILLLAFLAHMLVVAPLVHLTVSTGRILGVALQRRRNEI